MNNLKEEYVYKDCKIRMSSKSMSNFLYAIIMTKATISGTLGIGIYEYNRIQNSFNNVDIQIHIHPSQIEIFEEISGTKLKEPVKINLTNKN